MSMKAQLAKLAHEHVLLAAKQMAMSTLLQNIRDGKYEDQVFLTFYAEDMPIFRDWAESLGLQFIESPSDDKTYGYIALK